MDSALKIFVVNRKNFVFDEYKLLSEVQLSSLLGISLSAAVKHMPAQLYTEKTTLNEGENIHLLCAGVDLGLPTLRPILCAPHLHPILCAPTLCAPIL